MELPCKVLEQIAFNTRPQIEEHMLIVRDKSTHEEHLSQLLQTNNKHFKTIVIFLTGYNGIFNVINSIRMLHFNNTNTDEHGFIQTSILPGAYEIESLNSETKGISLDEEHFTEAYYPFTSKPNFSTLGSIIKISPQ